ncbi:LytR C-terminal domain-containing protein [Actinoplanes sp. URMC 104]|uniref:LytR C-terminal domain-containing protein n=1 Tax=Actinoplanes sp. URMC 104 TaxID=3423409 RepID=UPI003F1BE012
MSFTRVRATLVVAFLVTVAIVAVVVTVVRDSQAGATARRDCPPGVPLVDLRLPDQASQVTLRVLNGTGTAGLGERVTTDFRDRGFRMQPTAASRNKYAGIAVVRYGPRTVGAAQWIRAFFLGEAEPQYSASRTSDVIDVVIGRQYRQLATKTEVNQSLAQLSVPSPPPGTCAAPTNR